MSKFKLPLALFIGLRFGKSRRKSSHVSFITASSIIGIAIGVMALTVGLSAMNGFEYELENRVLSVIPQVDVYTSFGALDNYQKYESELLEDNKILATAPYINVHALLDKKNIFKALVIKGIDPHKEVNVVDISKFINKNELEQLTPGSNKIIIGKSLAQQYDIKKGDKVNFWVSKKTSYKQISSPETLQFTVAGFFSMNGSLDSLISYINFSDAQNIMGYEKNSTEGIGVKTVDFLNCGKIVSEQSRKTDKMVYIASWMRTQGHLYQDIQLVRLVIYIALFIVISVACFNIVSSLMMALNDKKSSIAILMSMGAQPSLISRIFISMGMINGAIGVSIGIVSGLIISLNLGKIFNFLESIIGHSILNPNLYFINFIPSKVDYLDFVIVGISALVICFISTLYPSWKASKILPAIELSKG